ncbi:MAG TPA: acetate--CoA ligase family protein, partial [Desulfobacteraceae bacterium]|nr:acetate--CoA ligase family protein [Desulfobacteraceae bacterium]
FPPDFCHPPAGETNAPGDTAVTVIDEYLSKQILSEAHIPVTEEFIVESVDQAREQAEQLGFPVVMKGLLPDMVHKTESGLVRLNITSAAQAEAQFLSLEKAVRSSGKILVQQQVKADVELIAGLVRDPQFGPCVMLGMGGVMAEILDDVLFRVAPLNHGEALEMISNLKSQKLLNGFRGAQKSDRNKTADILVTIGRLGWETPDFQEIDINPLIISNGQPVAVDASIVTFR